MSHFYNIKSIECGTYELGTTSWDLTKELTESILRRSPPSIPLSIEFSPEKIVGRVLGWGTLSEFRLWVTVEIGGGGLQMSEVRSYEYAMPKFMFDPDGPVDESNMRIIEFGLTNRLLRSIIAFGSLSKE